MSTPPTTARLMRFDDLLDIDLLEIYIGAAWNVVRRFYRLRMLGAVGRGDHDPIFAGRHRDAQRRWLIDLDVLAAIFRLQILHRAPRHRVDFDVGSGGRRRAEFLIANNAAGDD